MPRIDARARSVCGFRAPGSPCLCGVANRCERAPDPVELAREVIREATSRPLAPLAARSITIEIEVPHGR